MTSSLGLSDLFLEHAKVRIERAGHPDKLERLLWEAYESARSHWERVALAADDFVRYLAERLRQHHEGKPIEQLLEAWHLADLYLACACTQGVPEALNEFDRYYLAKLSAQFANGRYSATTIDEVCQQIRMDFLLPSDEGAPRIAQYEGRGPLLNMLNVSATRLAQRLSKSNRPASEEDDMAIIEAMSTGVDEELDLIKRRYYREFRQAVIEAFRGLSDDERCLLKLHWFDGLSMSKLGVIYGKDQSTIWRRLIKIREKIHDEVKRLVQERLHLSDSEFESMLAVIKSQLDVRTSQIFG